jgi:hypothetical protein
MTKHEIGRIYTDSELGKYLLIYDIFGDKKFGFVNLYSGRVMVWYDSMEELDNGNSNDILIGKPLNYFECPDCGYKVQPEEFFMIKG